MNNKFADNLQEMIEAVANDLGVSVLDYCDEPKLYSRYNINGLEYQAQQIHTHKERIDFAVGRGDETIRDYEDAFPMLHQFFNDIYDGYNKAKKANLENNPFTMLFSLNPIKRRQKSKIEILERVIMDLTDLSTFGDHEWKDIKEQTGVSEERAKEISEIVKGIFKKNLDSRG